MAVLLGYTALGLLIGRLIPLDPVRQSPYFATAVGVILLTTASARPGTGWLISTATALFSFGAILASRFGTRKISESMNQ